MGKVGRGGRVGDVYIYSTVGDSVGRDGYVGSLVDPTQVVVVLVRAV